MKKAAIFLMIFAASLCLIFLWLYRSDMARMANDETVIFSTWGYEYAPPEEVSEDWEENDLYMQAEEKTITTRGIVVEIVNNTDHDVTFGDYYALERKSVGEWRKLDYITDQVPDWNDMGYIIGTGGIGEFSFYWVDLYGELEPGSYRLEKLYIDDIGNNEINHLYCYFDVA